MSKIQAHKKTVQKIIKALKKISSTVWQTQYLLVYALYLDVICKDHQETQQAVKQYLHAAKTLAQIQSRLQGSASERTFQMDRTTIIRVDGQASHLNNILYASRNSEDILDWKADDLLGQPMSVLMTAGFGEYHSRLMVDGMQEGVKDYLTRVHKRYVGGSNRKVYRCFDVILKLS